MDALLTEFRLNTHDEKFDIFEKRHEASLKNDHGIRSILTKDAHSIQKLFEICDQNVKRITHLSENMLAIRSDVAELQTDKKIKEGVKDKLSNFIQIGKACTPILIFLLVLLAGFDSYKISENAKTLHENGVRVKAIVSDISK